MSTEGSGFKDYFSKQSDTYAKARPGYPDALFTYLASLCKEHELAWDCATGNGQAALSLIKHFKNVIATDGSEQQLHNAVQHKGITYKQALADDSGIESNTVDLITVANALHWFNLPAFYKEADRVLKHGGVLAVWTYAHSYIEDKNKKEIAALLENLSGNILGKYWPAGREIVMSGYKTINLPFEKIDAPFFTYQTKVDLEKLLGFVYSWSSTQQYISQTGNDPVPLIKDELLKLWGGDAAEIKTMTWELTVKAARKT